MDSVHIIPIGEYDPRVVQLILRKFPKRAYFVRTHKEDVDRATNTAISNARHRYEKILREGGAEIVDIETKYLDYRQAFLDLLRIIRKEEGNQIIINLHGGAREVNVIAGQLASLVGGLEMFWLPRSATGPIGTESFIEVVVLPPIPRLGSAEAHVLSYLLKKGGEATGTYAEISADIKERSGQPLAGTIDASRMTLTKAIRTLEEWSHGKVAVPLISRRRVNRATKIELSPKGRFCAEVLQILS